MTDGDGTGEAAGAEPALLADGVSKSYGETVAVDDVSLAVTPGEAFALIGPNGAGKTTLVRCLTGTARPDEGTVRLLGSVPADADVERIGLLPQSFSPPARLTARELVDYYAGLYEDPRDPEAVLAEVGLADADDTWYERLSGGQRRRVCVAAALVNDPDVLFLDEPTTGIDPAGRRTLWNVLEELLAAGTTLVLTTHDMAEATRLADRVGLLADGRLVAVDAPGALVRAHGGAPTLRVVTDAGPGALADARFSARSDGDALVVEGVAPTDIGDVVRTLDANGVAFESLEWSEPDLEDVYLSLAGDGAARDAVGNGEDGGPDATSRRVGGGGRR